MQKKFTGALLSWYSMHKRSLPWVGIKDPYLVWLSEIILQQTQVEQGKNYYTAFATAFPTVFTLAAAPEDVVMKMWEGLGYYSRARNMHHTARQIVQLYSGIFPAQRDQLIKLKGVGAYTASAILSYAFDKPYAVVDGNVFRILARVFGIYNSIETPEAKAKFEQLAYKLLDKKKSAIFNQAMMDFGSLVCKPKNPICIHCPYTKMCHAYLHNDIQLLPVKLKKAERRKRHFNFIVIMHKNNIIIEKRNEADIWKNLYQFPLVEANSIFTEMQLKKLPIYNSLLPSAIKKISTSIEYKQQLTHQVITAKFFIITIKNTITSMPPSWSCVSRDELKKFAFPGIIRTFLQELSKFID